MSTYCHRYYEVKTPIIHDYAYIKTFDEIDTSNLPDGHVVKIWDERDYQYRKWNAKKQEWKKLKKCDYKWTLVKLYTEANHGYHPTDWDITIGDVNREEKEPGWRRIPLAKEGTKLDENICYCDNGGIIRDNFISDRGWGDRDYDVADRGWPDDMSDDLKQEFTRDMDYTWGHTYVTLSEWNKIFNSEFEVFKKKIAKKIQETEFKQVNEKLDLLTKLVKDPSYTPPKKKKKKNEDEDETTCYEDTLEYIWEEDFWDLMMIRREINRAYDAIESFGYMADGDVRIIYYLS